MRQSFIDVLRSSADEQRALFSATASDLETRAENIEKDLYVCWVLDFLFNQRKDDAIGLYFKGGTSLSNAYGLIQRFSEDIDIGIYKADLNVPLEADIAALSFTQQQKALGEQVDEAARQYMSGPLKSSLEEEIAAIEGEVGQTGHFSLGFGTIPTGRRKHSTFWFWDTEASLIRAAAISRRRSASNAEHAPILCQPRRGRLSPTSHRKCQPVRISRSPM